jgi:hypothetical protein
MAYGFNRFLTTHTGSLPRPDDLTRAMFAKEEGQNLSSAEASVSSNAPTRAAGAAIVRS